MIPIYRMKVIHVEVTYACNLHCSNCTRFVGHHGVTDHINNNALRIKNGYSL